LQPKTDENPSMEVHHLVGKISTYLSVWYSALRSV